jgi:hypothetical protein
MAKGYEVPVVLFIEADDEDEAYIRAQAIMNKASGKRYHGCEVEEDEKKYVLIPVLGG